MAKPKNKLELYRELHGLSWRQFADKVGISRRALRQIAEGKCGDIMVSTVEKIKAATGLDLGDYFVKPKP